MIISVQLTPLKRIVRLGTTITLRRIVRLYNFCIACIANRQTNVSFISSIARLAFDAVVKSMIATISSK